MNSRPLSAVVCAAGAGSRMGCTKALAKLDNLTFLQSIVESLNAAKNIIGNQIQIVVVLGADAQNVVQYHSQFGWQNVQYAINPDWQNTYMLESLKCGVDQIQNPHTVLHWPVDCVDVHPTDIARLIHTDAPIAALQFQGKHGHPICINKTALQQFINNYHNYNTLRDFINSVGISYIDAHYPALMNCNTPEKLEEYLANKN